MKILLLGAKGMLGSDCKIVLSRNNEVIAPDKKELNIISWDKVIESLHDIMPNLIVNCAGFTNVDACEKQNETFAVKKVNIEGPRNLSQGAARYDSKLVHISSDYIFNGQKPIPQPYFEDDPLDPLSAYGRSKMESEVAVRENAPDYMIIRTGWLYGRNGSNFISSLLAHAFSKKKKPLKVVDDQYGSPTWTLRLAEQIEELIKYDIKGTFHVTAEEYCSRLEYAQYIFEKLKIHVPIEPCKMSDYPQPAKRPQNCILENR
ncbi:MAG: dTDP-4-dehydrorhamnose reductase, partial [Desulfobacteraceae bacterium]